jgi:hypothetical protein
MRNLGCQMATLYYNMMKHLFDCIITNINDPPNLKKNKIKILKRCDYLVIFSKTNVPYSLHDEGDDKNVLRLFVGGRCCRCSRRILWQTQQVVTRILISLRTWSSGFEL